MPRFNSTFPLTFLSEIACPLGSSVIWFYWLDPPP